MSKVMNFATVVVENQTVCGQNALEYILACFLKNRTADSGVRIVTDVIKSALVSKMSGSKLVSCGNNCTFTPSGTLNLTEVELTPCAFHINLELCYQDLEGVYNGLNSGNLNTQDLGADFNRALRELLIGTMGETFEKVLWQGTTGTTMTGCTCTVDSLPSQILTNHIHASGVTLSKANIIGYVDQMMAKLPPCLLEDTSKLKIYMNPKSLLYYKQALGALGVILPSESLPTTYDGIEIYTIGAIPDNKMFVFQPENLVIAVGAMDNFSQLNILDMRQHNLDNSVRMSIQGKVDAKFIYEAEVVALG